MPVFFEEFERHAHGEGLKAHSTHYCAGCGHGLAHKYLADAIEALGVQDRTVLVNPVGCSVFAFYYFDVGSTQAAHGRAPAVAIGHKLANPNSVVISYQGDGDLASIGLAETIHTAQLGLPITVIFVNNAIYGMTGGQMAPTTLMGQHTATSPLGRAKFQGEPLKMAELIAQLDGPVYVERVALFDAKQRKRAQKAIKKAVQMQLEGRGYAFVEVLSECPTHLGLSPEEAESWVKDQMVPVFPLGVKKDLKPEPWFQLESPNFSADTVLKAIGGTTTQAACFGASFPVHLEPEDLSLKLAGAGGDGAQTAAYLIARAAINEGFDATHIPSYGPESRGGTSYADVHIAKDEVLSPASSHPNLLVAFNAPSLAKFGPAVKPGGVIVYDSGTCKTLPEHLEPGVRLIPVPFTEIATELGKSVVKNVVALGALQAATNLLPQESLLATISEALKNKRGLEPVNREAFARGAQAARAVLAASA